MSAEDDNAVAVVADIERSEREILDLYVKHCNGPIGHQHLYLFGIARRAIAQSAAFRQMVSSRNSLVASSIVRLQLDTVLRLYALFWVADPEDFAAGRVAVFRPDLLEGKTAIRPAAGPPCEAAWRPLVFAVWEKEFETAESHGPARWSRRASVATFSATMIRETRLSFVKMLRLSVRRAAFALRVPSGEQRFDQLDDLIVLKHAGCDTEQVRRLSGISLKFGVLPLRFNQQLRSDSELRDEILLLRSFGPIALPGSRLAIGLGRPTHELLQLVDAAL
ncbi:hypothetical protein V1281_004743 [Nitrobacteraceae bacterium AZCC 2161]